MENRGVEDEELKASRKGAKGSSTNTKVRPIKTVEEDSPEEIPTQVKKKAKVAIEENWHIRDECLPRAPVEGAGQATLRILSWNVAGLRAPSRVETLQELARKYDPDIICLQETKIQDSHEEDFASILDGYRPGMFASSSAKKGYSGVAIFVRFTSDASDEGGKAGGKKQKTLNSFFGGEKGVCDKPTSGIRKEVHPKVLIPTT